MADIKQAKVEILADGEALAKRAAAWLCDLAKSSEGTFRVALSGGSTPKRLYELLATVHSEAMPWDRIQWYFGDERYVPADHEKSNYRMAHEAMLGKAPVPRHNIHRVLTESETPDICAGRYQSDLQRAYGSQILDRARPLFDIVLLGLGEDAHTGSLFPGNKAVDETKKWVVPVPDGTPPTRITMTFPVLNSTKHAAFLIAGDGKRPALERLLKGDKSAPASHIAPIGDLYLFADEAAKVAGL
jgi:6-phosphogluconolactonase